MNIFLDTANSEEIRKGVATGVVTGVTTNPSIIARENKPFKKCVEDILAINPDLTILLEVIATDTESINKEARELFQFSKNIIIKIPMIEQGLASVKLLTQDGIKTTVTLVFSVNQAIAAACSGADYVAPFVGRLDDINSSGVDLVSDIRLLFDAQKINTKIIAASIRSPQTVAELFLAGCDVVTMPGTILQAMLKHPLTDSGLQKFMEDWNKVPVM